MSFWNLNKLHLEPFRPGILSKAEIGENLIMAFMEIEAEKEDKGHSHQNDQCGVVIDGKIEMIIGEERKILSTNESYFIPAGVRHGWKTYDEAVRLLDITFSQRMPETP